MKGNRGLTRAKEQLQTDALYRVRALKAAATHSTRTKDPAMGRTYVYQFNWKSPRYPDDIGAMHGLDLVFAFGNLSRNPQALDIKNGQIDESTQRLSDSMADAWVSFATNGTPSSEKLPKWPEYESKERNTMVFDTKPAVVSDPGGALRKLWD